MYEGGELALGKVLVDHEYGRIVWAMFLHADEAHIFNNMLILYFLGAMIEQEIGHLRFGVAYFVSGSVGNLLSLAAKFVKMDTVPSVGASGAIFGLDGVMLALVLFSGKQMPNVTPIRVLLMIVLSLYSGFTAQNVDNAAHVGGLIAGFLLGAIFCMADRLYYNKKHGGDSIEY